MITGAWHHARLALLPMLMGARCAGIVILLVLHALDQEQISAHHVLWGLEPASFASPAAAENLVQPVHWNQHGAFRQVSVTFLDVTPEKETIFFCGIPHTGCIPPSPSLHVGMTRRVWL